MNVADNIPRCWSATRSQGGFSVIFLSLRCAQSTLRAHNHWHCSELPEWKWDLYCRHFGDKIGMDKDLLGHHWRTQSSARDQGVGVLGGGQKGLIYTIPININLEHQYRQSPQLPYQRDRLTHNKNFCLTSVTCKFPWHSCLPPFTSGIWVSQRIVEGKSWFSLLSHITRLRSLIINVRCLWAYRG